MIDNQESFDFTNVFNTQSQMPLTTRVLLETKVVDDRVDLLYPSLGYGDVGSAGFDLRAMLDDSTTLNPGEVLMVGTGLAVWVKHPTLAGIVLPRSGLGHKHGIVLGNLVGLIDADYQGELKVSLWNRSTTPYTIEPGERIAQFVLTPVYQVKFDRVEHFSNETERGEGGFGHSGRI